MIETEIINIGFASIAVLVIANLYYAIRIVDKKYDIFSFLEKEETEESITWNQK